jgi:uncharacterized membrane protein
MTTIEQSLDVEVPVSTAYNQWTQFEDFPQFMEGVEAVTQVTDDRLHWKTKIAGVEREFDAEITEQHPDERVAWKSTSGAPNAGVVTFHRLDDDHTRVTLQLDVEPDGPIETVGDWAGVLDRQVEEDLDRFSKHITGRGEPTGAWRGNVENPSSR